MKFFEGDQASKFTQDAIEFCKEFERQRRATVEFVEMLDKASLFEQKSVAFTPRDAQGNAGETQKIADYWAISEEGLNALPDCEFQDIRNTGRSRGRLCPHGVADELAARDPAHDAPCSPCWARPTNCISAKHLTGG